jgi:hypothetical protein
MHRWNSSDGSNASLKTQSDKTSASLKIHLMEQMQYWKLIWRNKCIVENSSDGSSASFVENSSDGTNTSLKAQLTEQMHPWNLSDRKNASLKLIWRFKRIVENSSNWTSASLKTQLIKQMHVENHLMDKTHRLLKTYLKYIVENSVWWNKCIVENSIWRKKCIVENSILRDNYIVENLPNSYNLGSILH